MKKLLIFRLIVPLIFFTFIFSGCGNIIGLITDYLDGETEILFENFGYKTDKYSFEYIDKEDREYFRNLISAEMNKYPDGYNKIIGSYKVCVVKNLKYKQFQRNTGGFSSGKDKIIFVCITSNTRPINLLTGKPFYFSDNEIRDIFHHEMQHLAEYSLWKTSDYYWEEYENLYTGSHINISATNYTIDYDAPVPSGFITHYSTMKPAEDRAEIMGHWFAYNITLISKAKNDNILDIKIVLLFTLLRDKFSFPSPLLEYNQSMERY
jgi:hypothetical protein